MNEKTKELLDRTFSYGVNTLKFLRKLPDDPISRIPKSQVGQSSVFIGSNYEAAQGAVSKKDFTNHIANSYKETRENIYWMRVLSELDEEKKHEKEFTEFLKEAKDLKQVFFLIKKSAKASLTETVPN
jgi:four helix bundle protein